MNPDSYVHRVTQRRIKDLRDKDLFESINDYLNSVIDNHLILEDDQTHPEYFSAEFVAKIVEDIQVMMHG